MRQHPVGVWVATVDRSRLQTVNPNMFGRLVLEVTKRPVQGGPVGGPEGGVAYVG